MSFWGSRSSDKSTEGPKDFSSSDDASFDAVGYGGGGGGGGVEDIQQFSMQLQQQVLVQTVITSLTETAFLKCITGKPGDSLSGKEAACIHATVNKMMDTNDFMMGRLAKKQQQASGGGL